MLLCGFLALPKCFNKSIKEGNTQIDNTVIWWPAYIYGNLNCTQYSQNQYCVCPNVNFSIYAVGSYPRLHSSFCSGQVLECVYLELGTFPNVNFVCVIVASMFTTKTCFQWNCNSINERSTGTWKHHYFDGLHTIYGSLNCTQCSQNLRTTKQKFCFQGVGENRINLFVFDWMSIFQFT